MERRQSRLGRQEESIVASQQLMSDCNPAIIPRNHRVEEALDTERGDNSVMEKLLEVLSRPYKHSSEMAAYCMVPGGSASS